MQQRRWRWWRRRRRWWKQDQQTHTGSRDTRVTHTNKPATLSQGLRFLYNAGTSGGGEEGRGERGTERGERGTGEGRVRGRGECGELGVGAKG